MPLYVYKCDKCGHQFEQLAKLSDPNPSCPEPKEYMKVEPVDPAQPQGELRVLERGVEPCGGTTTKLVVGGSFHLKGSGWASDGYSG